MSRKVQPACAWLRGSPMLVPVDCQQFNKVTFMEPLCSLCGADVQMQALELGCSMSAAF